MRHDGDLWIFAYGSLMWRPDFDHVDRLKARLSGYHRSLCIESHVYRGTPDRPGLVLGLDRGGSCVGVVFRIAADQATATLEAVRARELVTGVYREVQVEVLVPDGTRRTALTYVADRNHSQYVRRLERTAMLARIQQCVGCAGPNADYVRNTHLHLLELGIADATLRWIVETIDHRPHGPALKRVARPHQNVPDEPVQ